MRQMLGRDAAAFVENLDRHAAVPATGAHRHRGARRRIFRRVVEQVEEDLLEEHEIDLDHRKVGVEVDFDAVALQHLAGTLQRGADDLAEIDHRRFELERAGLEPGHVEQVGDEAIEPLGLVLHRRDQFLADVLIVELAIGPEAGHRAQNGGEGGAQIVRDRGQQGRAQPLGLGEDACLVDIGDQLDAFDRDRSLVREGVE